MVTPERSLFHSGSEVQLKTTGDDAGLLVVMSGVTGQMEYFSGGAFHGGSQVDGSVGTSTISVGSCTEPNDGYGRQKDEVRP